MKPANQSCAELAHNLRHNLRRLRVARGWSQEDCGKACGVHRTRIAQIERGEANPGLASLATIARAMGVDVAELLAAVAPDTPTPANLESKPWSRKRSRGSQTK